MIEVETVNLFRPAGLWVRVVAHMIDFVALALLGVGIWYISHPAGVVAMVAFNIPFLLYKPVMESRYGATLGKMACGIQVQGLDGSRISMTTAYRRFLPFLAHNISQLFLSVQIFQDADYLAAETLQAKAEILQAYPLHSVQQVIVVCIAIDCLAIAFNAQKRALHDSLAGTRCVFKDRSEVEPLLSVT